MRPFTIPHSLKMIRLCPTATVVISAFSSLVFAEEDLGAMWGTAEEEAKYYPIVNIPIPPTVPMRPGGSKTMASGVSGWKSSS